MTLRRFPRIFSVTKIRATLRLENGEYTPVGSHRAQKSDIRLIAATNQNLLAQMQAGTMRIDFFYRIHGFEILMPPLRERKEDLPLLIEHFLSIYSQAQIPPTLPGAILNQLYQHDWPGNVRELYHVLQRYLATQRLTFSETRNMTIDDLADDQGGVTPHDAPP